MPVLRSPGSKGTQPTVGTAVRSGGSVCTPAGTVEDGPATQSGRSNIVTASTFGSSTDFVKVKFREVGGKVIQIQPVTGRGRRNMGITEGWQSACQTLWNTF